MNPYRSTFPHPLVDIGANLTHESFGHDLDAVLERAREASVHQLVVTGASREGSRHALELARAHPDRLFATAGVHPHRRCTACSRQRPGKRCGCG